MKVYSLSVILAPSSGSSVILQKADSLETFTYFQRGSVSEFMTFTSTTLAERTPLGGRQSIQDDKSNYVFHVYKRSVPEHLTGKFSVKLTSLECSITSH